MEKPAGGATVDAPLLLPGEGHGAREDGEGDEAEDFSGDDSGCESESSEGSQPDPWDLPELQDNSPQWSSLTTRGKVQRVLVGWIAKPIVLLCLLYLFVCSLDFLSSAFRLLGGKAAGEVFQSNAILQNPVAGLMIGVLATVLVQSSSTSTSIVVTMVASGILEVRPAIPIIMGANIGTSVTNTIVSLAQSANRDEFRRAFGGATVHDMFNWLTVLVFLPMEVMTGYLYHLTSAIVESGDWSTYKGADKDMLKTITKPFTSLVVQLDKSVINAIAIGDNSVANKSLIKEWCEYTTETVLQNVTEVQNVMVVMEDGTTASELRVVGVEKNVTSKFPVKPCSFMFHDTGMSDTFVGVILLAISLCILCTCLVIMVKILNSVFKGKIAKIIKNTLNSDLPGCMGWVTGYIALFIGAGMTILVQSSSVFTSAMTPLVGVGVIRLERMYPLTLGSNIGTTTTGLLAAMAASGDNLPLALQIALCHLFFNISGILLFYPIPAMRFPIALAKMMGNTTAKYRWFAIFYLAAMFFFLPALIFLLSLAGTIYLMVFVGVALTVLAFVIFLNILQHKCKARLPKKLQTWDFLPFKWMHSLEPIDRVISKVLSVFRKCCPPPCCRSNNENKLKTADGGNGNLQANLIYLPQANRLAAEKLLQEGGELQTLNIQNLQHTTINVPDVTDEMWANSKDSFLDQTESGYCTRVPSETNTPFASKCPSMVKIVPS